MVSLGVIKRNCHPKELSSNLSALGAAFAFSDFDFFTCWAFVPYSPLLLCCVCQTPVAS